MVVRGLNAVALAAAILLLPAGAAAAAPGDLDRSFGGDGKVIRDFGEGDEADAVAIQDDGKVVVAGDVVPPVPHGHPSRLQVVRFRPGGRLDHTFAGDGVKLVDLPGSQDYGTDVAIQRNGRIVVSVDTGFADRYGSVFHFGVVRLRPDGRLDRTFDDDGIQTTDFGSSDNTDTSDSPYGLAIQSDGKIVVVGVSGDSTLGDYGSGSETGDGFAIVRYLRNGELDPSFSDDGKERTFIGGAVTPYGTYQDSEAHAVTVQDDGKIVVAGRSYVGSGPDFALARYDQDGALDSTFSGDGTETTDFGTGDAANDVILQPGGRILAVGSALGDFGLARYEPNGTPDVTFSLDGKETTDFDGSSDGAEAVALDSSGRLVLGGYAKTPQHSDDFALARYTPDGDLDSAFSGDGKVTTNLTGTEDVATDLALDARGRILLSGSTGETDHDSALARYRAGESQ